jgi:hypothetical protein
MAGSNIQDKSVIEDVNNLIDTYLKQERTIILAVIPSNVDIATVDILERAQIVRAYDLTTLGGCCRAGHCARVGSQTYRQEKCRLMRC